MMWIFFMLPLFMIATSAPESEEKGALTTVEKVDVQRYAGLWYEIARIPNTFQRKCTSGTTAFYALRQDGRIDVVNSCTDKNGKTKKVKGIARITDPQTNSKLQVSFVRFLGLSLFWGDYWIIGLGDDYDYALVGTPGRKYGWILSRTPALSQEKMEVIFAQLRDQGYNPDEFQLTKP